MKKLWFVPIQFNDEMLTIRSAVADTYSEAVENVLTHIPNIVAYQQITFSGKRVWVKKE